jgi:hypothetical protein
MITFRRENDHAIVEVERDGSQFKIRQMAYFIDEATLRGGYRTHSGEADRLIAQLDIEAGKVEQKVRGPSDA